MGLGRLHSFTVCAAALWHAGEEGVGSVRFVAWQRVSPQEAPADGGTLTVPLPVPYPLPPTKYQAGDTPWAVDTLWPGKDSFGCTIDNPHGAFYGLLESMEWGDL
jgi:hypothetical protein